MIGFRDDLLAEKKETQKGIGKDNTNNIPSGEEDFLILEYQVTSLANFIFYLRPTDL